MFIGILLVILGGLFLGQSLGYISGDVWNKFWPVILIVAGIALVIGRKKVLK